MNKAEVLFLCTGNTARSQMAEGLLRAQAGDRFEVYSAGLDPRPLNPLAIAVMAEVGIDISRHESTDVCAYPGHMHFGYLITVCDRAAANCPIFPGISQRLDWSLEDPAAAQGSDEERLAVFRRERDQLTALIEEFVAQH
jgi:arsenate reductase